MKNSSIQTCAMTQDSNKNDLSEQLTALPCAPRLAKTDLDLFIADTVGNVPIKDEVTSMEYPLFSLTKKRDIRIRTYSRNGKTLRIIPSTIGTATIFDKDILIYALSQIIQATESGRPVSRRVLIKSYAFLESTKRSVGGASYERIIEMCRRLKGTIIETNIKTNEEERTEGFSMIEAYSIKRYSKNGKGALEVELTLSEWLYRNLLSFSVLTLHPDYFTLAPLERRLYELARKHCGDQAYWKCGIDLLQEKCGSTQERKSFVSDLRKIVQNNLLPDYRVALDHSTQPMQVVFLSKDHKKLLHEINKANLINWLDKLLRSN